MTDFDSAVADFTHFSTQQGYPSKLLWATPGRMLHWRQLLFVLSTNPKEYVFQAKATIQAAIRRNIGVQIHGVGKTRTITVCRLDVPVDELDAQYKMIPATGLKISVATNPGRVVLVKSRLLWWGLQHLGAKSAELWE